MVADDAADNACYQPVSTVVATVIRMAMAVSVSLRLSVVAVMPAAMVITVSVACVVPAMCVMAILNRDPAAMSLLMLWSPVCICTVVMKTVVVTVIVGRDGCTVDYLISDCSLLLSWMLITGGRRCC